MKLLLNFFLGFVFIQANAQSEYAIQTSFNASIVSKEACDACGCSNTGGNFGFGDLSEKNSFTLRFLNQEYSSKENLFNNSPWSSEYFNTIQALSLNSIHKKIKILTIIPYHFLRREASSFSNSLSGIGDISVLGIYEIYSSKDEQQIKQKWYASLGLKLPTGTYQSSFRGNTNPGFQLGTGSFDYLFLTEYQVAFKNFNWSSFINYLYKTENNKDFRFGNQINFSSIFGYKISINKIILFPQLGYAYERTAENIDFGVMIPKSDSELHLLRMGIDAKWKNITFGGHYFDPVSQNLFNRTVRLQHRFNISITYKFDFSKSE